MQKITTFLWFDGAAEEAMNHYVSIMEAMLQMEKIDIERLRQAYDQR